MEIWYSTCQFSELDEMGVVFLCICALFCFSLCLEFAILIGASSVRHTDVILIGATGDLSSKYLWRGFFNLFVNHVGDQQSFAFYGVGRSPVKQAEPILADILNKQIKCSEDFKILKMDDCNQIKNVFIQATSYSMLTTEIDYLNFCSVVHNKRKASGKMNGDMIFYLSIPSSSYIVTAQYINKNCRPRNSEIKVRIVLEKPFGNNQESARIMSDTLAKLFAEDEIYRVDHYLGKTIVREILNFRLLNKHLEARLNRDDVERVEIFMKETIGVKGRLEFFDQTGIIRDVFQNHLTELLIMIAMDLPNNLSSPEDVKRAKLRLLLSIRPAAQSSVLTGQYSDYIAEVKEELTNSTNSKYTPTFAAALLHINSTRWEGVPFVLVGGKCLLERSGFIRIIFKQNNICVSCAENSPSDRREQLVFQIGHGSLKSPAILISKSLGSPVWPPLLKEENVNVNHLFGDKSSNLFIAKPHKNPDAYTLLIEDILLGKRDKFVGSKHLLACWDIWSDVITELEKMVPKIYQVGDEAGILDFSIKGSLLTFTDKSKQVEEKHFEDEKQQTPATFLGHKLVSSTTTCIANKLAEDIFKTVHTVLKDNTNFNIAFSGGNSPKLLFRILAQSYAHLPWNRIHVWQVDERCVSFTDNKSNFYHLRETLLKFVPIPHENIHPMPVDVNGDLCNAGDTGAITYKESLEYYLPNLSFDYIVLGLGSDGHTASLFPNSPALTTDELVVLTENSSLRRMTLTFAIINKSKHISVLVTGSEKSQILKQIEQSKGSTSDFPILGVQPNDGSLTWYIDLDALSF